MTLLSYLGQCLLFHSLLIYAVSRGWFSDMVPWELGVTYPTLQEDGVKEKSSTYKTCHQVPYSDQVPGPPGCSGVPPPGVSTGISEEGELTLETERQMVRPCASAQQHEALQRAVEVYQTREQTRETPLCLL